MEIANGTKVSVLSGRSGQEGILVLGAKQILAVTRAGLRRRRRSVVIKVVTPPSLRCSPLPRPEHLITRGRAVTLYSYTATTWIIT